jgi:hypothetical protein
MLVYELCLPVKPLCREYRWVMTSFLYWDGHADAMNRRV